MPSNTHLFAESSAAYCSRSHHRREADRSERNSSAAPQFHVGVQTITRTSPGRYGTRAESGNGQRSGSLTAAQDLSGYGRAKERPSRLLRDAYHRRHRFRSRFGCFGWLLSLATSYRRTGTVATIAASTICVSATLSLCTGAICTRAISSNPIICTSATVKPTI